MRMMYELEVSVNAIFDLGSMGRPSFTCFLILFFPIFESHAMWNLDHKYTRGRAFAKPTSRFNSTRIIIIFVWISLCMISLVPSIFLIRNTFFLHKFAEKPVKKTIAVMSIMNDNIESKSPFERPRSVVKQLLSKEQPEGDGALVRRSIGRPELRNLDPFLLLDEFTVTPPGGFPDHPHRGFETVTYMLKGAFTHRDFAGHKGTIKAGDLQWMTAGRGIVHCEMPASKGVQHGLQLWVNLSKKDKMIEPAYQELEDKDIPKVEKDGVRASVIAGEALGIKSPVYTRTPTLFLDFTMKAGAVLHQEVPEGWNAFAYVLEGEAIFGNVDSLAVTAHHTVQLSAGNGLSVWNKSNNPCRFVLIGGRPLNEPVVQYGPFVMNAKEEIIQAIQDYQQSKNGFERAINWHSDPIVLSEAHD